MQADIIIIGGGIAGISAAYFLSQHASVIVMEREDSIGYHSSGRTAAQFTAGISADTMRRLAHASRSFLHEPPSGFAPERILSPRGCLTLGRADQEMRLKRLYDRLISADARVRYLDRSDAFRVFPAFVESGVAYGVYECDAMDIDVDMLLQGYARGAKARGTKILTRAPAIAIEKKSGQWVVSTPSDTISAPLLLNAAGAWVDEITRLAGLEPIGLTPHRRTAFTFAAPHGVDTSRWPHVSNLDYQWYIQPDAGGILMGSLAEAVPTLPSDVYADDVDVAQAIQNIEQDTILRIDRPLSTWAGLRNFVADKNPVSGTRPGADGFFWLAGHGGCGILTSPALGQATAAVMLDRELPEPLRELGISAADLAPDRKTLIS